MDYIIDIDELIPSESIEREYMELLETIKKDLDKKNAQGK